MGWAAAVGKRGGIILPPDIPPGGEEDFGPTLGVDLVKTGTAPQAVTHPGGSPTVVNPGDDIAAKITTAGTNGTLWFVKGTHTNTSRKSPLAGQRLFFESAAGYNRTAADSAMIDGTDSNFEAHFMSGANNVFIKGGVFMRQGNSAGDATTWHSAILAEGSGAWTVEDAIIKDNRNVGLKFQAPNCTARRVYITNNGRYGIETAVDFTNNLFEKCRWSLNNSRQLNSGGAAGGSKFTSHVSVTTPLVVRECWVHDNFGFGIWTDVPGFSGNIHYLENVVEDNRRTGLFLEGPLGGCKMQRNYARNNGWDPNPIGGHNAGFEGCLQLKVTHSDSSLGSGIRGDISLNDVDYTLTQSSIHGGMLLLWNHNPPHPNQTRNWDVHNNRFWMRSTQTKRIAGDDDDPEGTQLWDGDNDFYDNEYHVASLNPAYWQWDSGAGTGALKTYSQWQTFHPGDDIPLVLI